MHLLIAIIARALRQPSPKADTDRIVIQAQSDGMTFLTAAKDRRGAYGIQG